MPSLIAIWIATTITFIILTKLPTGIEADSFGKAGLAALVFGLLNALTSWFINNTFVNFLTLGMVALVGNTILFALSAFLVPGFRLRKGILSAALGALGIIFINGIVLVIVRAIIPGAS
ncbi:phage holin family protein [cf. Phormidesmis sp. LEGE 11477]|uniref:phage holin family protein n=1 Tax=cf. Phormidesmis sp. LEGE 11477 TaxID=1828680 RepID=UPI00187E48C5|nr:phage holin family protein [cf. Phormidesmis sp. LEGE 11477]MBE9060372.1 phage holin family protein [cf. Phormidesmis sp. LEGE 11477]